MLFHLETPVFLNGQLVSGGWTPRVPKLITTSRTLSKNRYTVYPTLKKIPGLGFDEPTILEGVGTFVELTNTITYERVGLDLDTAVKLQNGIEAVAIGEPENKTTTGSYRLSTPIVGGYTHEFSVEYKRTVMVDWKEGPPEQETT
jgi:hypothetical protein